MNDQATSFPSPPEILLRPLSLGNVTLPSRFFLAPLAGYTGLAFRQAVRSCGGLGHATTDLINARSLIERRRRAFELAETCPEDRPLSIQIFGHVPHEMQEAARMVQDLGASAVDINMGCPVRKVVRTGGGSALMCQVENAATLVAGIIAAVKIPVTVKMRLGWDDESLTAPALARRFEEIGVAAVIVHGRTREQGFKGSVNRAGIRAVVEAVDQMPVVANGDVRTIADAARTFEETGCAAVSIGRGALANPFFFKQLDSWAKTGDPGPAPTFEERLALMELHFSGLLERRGERYACLQFRKTLKWYSHFTRMPRRIYLCLVNLVDSERFFESLEQLRLAGPTSPLPGYHDAAIPVPSGPIDKW